MMVSLLIGTPSKSTEFPSWVCSDWTCFVDGNFECRTARSHEHFGVEECVLRPVIECGQIQPSDSRLFFGKACWVWEALP